MKTTEKEYDAMKKILIFPTMALALIFGAFTCTSVMAGDASHTNTNINQSQSDYSQMRTAPGTGSMHIVGTQAQNENGGATGDNARVTAHQKEDQLKDYRDISLNGHSVTEIHGGLYQKGSLDGSARNPGSFSGNNNQSVRIDTVTTSNRLYRTDAVSSLKMMQSIRGLETGNGFSSATEKMEGYSGHFNVYENNGNYVVNFGEKYFASNLSGKTVGNSEGTPSTHSNYVGRLDGVMTGHTSTYQNPLGQTGSIVTVNNLSASTRGNVHLNATNTQTNGYTQKITTPNGYKYQEGSVTDTTHISH